VTSSRSKLTLRSTPPARTRWKISAPELSRQGVVSAPARVKQDLLAELDAYGLTTTIGPDRIFPTLPTAVTAYQAWHPGLAPQQPATTSSIGPWSSS
jgi:hypothetical protein